MLELFSKYFKSDWVKVLYGEVFFLCVYLYFMLVNIWVEFYGIIKLVIVLGIFYLIWFEKNVLVDYEWGMVKEVYEKIEKDLKLGFLLVNDDYYVKLKFYFNKKVVYVFVLCFYLIKGEWDLVVLYFDYVFGVDLKLVLRNW